MAKGPKITSGELLSDGPEGGQRRTGLIVGILLAVTIGVPVLLLAAFMLVHRFGDDTWRAKVISVEGREVCTEPDKGERDPGWAVPFCLDYGAVTASGKPVPVRVGQCIEIESKHPAFYVNRVVPCA